MCGWRCVLPISRRGGHRRRMQSMTGFGRGAAANELWHAAVEISSVNRKQAEVVVQAPREIAELEGRIRKEALEHVSR
ncbi:MAG: hypothetical protein KGQ89_09970, partial [Verrucomicrobia bacterium]|nr:hypothetical protein [Verrucomicrobiota bacterium]